MVMKLTSLFVIIFLLTTFSGCAESEERDMAREQSINKETAVAQPSDHFKSHFQDAGLFLDLKHKGDEYRKNGMYAEAIESYERALKEHAYSRPEQAIASSRIAATYEQMRSHEMAAKYYEIAAEATMNEDQVHEYGQKAKELYQKSRQTNANHDSE